MTQTTITVNNSELRSGDLHRILREALIFASTDESIRSINAVHLESTGDRLIAVGTNRFVLGVSSHAVVLPKFTAVIHRSQVKLILHLIPGGRSARWTHWQPITLKVTPKATRLHLVCGENAITVPLMADDTFPKWRTLLPTADDPKEVPAVFSANPKYLGLFNQVGEPRSFPQFRMRSGNKPIVCRVGPDFIGLVMPIRQTDAEDPWALPEWVADANG